MSYDTYKLDCGDTGKATCCRCERDFIRDNMFEHSEEAYCEDCYYNMFATCYNCEKVVEIEDLDSSCFCEDCASGREDLDD